MQQHEKTNQTVTTSLSLILSPLEKSLISEIDAFNQPQSDRQNMNNSNSQRLLKLVPVGDLNHTTRFEFSTSTKRILIADGNADLRFYLKNILGQLWQVESVENGTEALIAVLKDPPDLILSNIMMPGLDGFDLIKALKHQTKTKSIPIILHSADDYLVKPFSAKELISKVKFQLEGIDNA